MEQRILFLINGMGLGNSTRCGALMQELAGEGFAFDLVTARNGLDYFSSPSLRERLKIGEVFALQPMGYEIDVKLSGLLRAVPNFISVVFRNRKYLRGILQQKSYAAVLTDSDYSLWSRGFQGRPPVIAINNSDAVVESVFHSAWASRGAWTWQLGVEGCDYFFHKLFPDYVVSPRLEMCEPRCLGRRLITPPIVRQDIGHPPLRGLRSDMRRLLVIPGGSALALTPQELCGLKWPREIAVKVLSPPPSETLASGRLEFVGRSYDLADLFDWSDALLINGGYSSISESLLQKKPTLIVPVPGHAEQWLNARRLESAGLGILANKDNLQDKLNLLIRDFAEIEKKHTKLFCRYDGARAAAKWIRGIIENDFDGR